MSDQPGAAKPDILSVGDLLESISAGEMRIPRFQRPYVWSTDDMLQLFDSVFLGYPIGSLLIWQTDRSDITSLERIGPIELPKHGPQLKSYVVDGHQRLATLMGVLMLPDNYPRERVDDWRWWIAYDLVDEQFVHIRERGKNISLRLLPLRSVLRTVDFARRTREISGSSEFSDDQIETLLDRADRLQKRIREYRVPMTVMKSSSLDAAVAIFARVNQRGRDMTPDQMVSALTFRDREEGDFDLASSIDEILGELRGQGYGDLQRRTILQVVLAAAKLDFTRPSYEKIVDRTQYGAMRAAVTRGGASLRRAVQFLARDVGVETSRLLPYASIAVMLSIYFDALGSKKLAPAQKQVLLRWFWATSFNGWYSGANTTDVRRAGDQMRELAKSGDATKFSEFFDRPIRQFPETYDRRSARVRASLLVQILEGKPLDPRNGRPIDGFSVFADEAARDIPYFFPKQKRPVVSNPANRVILPEGFPRNARVEFLKAAELNNAADVFASHFVDDEALEALQREDFERFVRLRENSILGVERRFLRGYGLGFDLSAARNNEEIDSDE
ncbi:DUF262 domain-containing protein [Bradyrhizobium manausense]|uniref:GmrSD restriction endonuclease domain-containing protein n=1 Tax=Bradyrhizobium manausense TaxID=989370 RepID=UPI001BA9E605|nr:DUF262 domain-containing protein [Bradyrhizobium manausense]MBR0831933.1 DUF262 domain-containing protein [Bradyrhizobium manausense]